MAIDKELLDQLLAGRDPQEVFARDGLIDDLKKALSERILNAELDEHLEGERADAKPNRRNGSSRKTMLTGASKIDLAIPRDRAGTFDPQLIARYQRRFPDFDGKIISMYARGMTVREIRGHLEDLYGIAVSPDLISTVTDAVLDEVAEWQNRPLDACYPLVFFDAIRVKIRDEGFVRNKAVYIALGILPDGTKEILGIWIEQTEGAKFWLRVMNELKSRGVADVLIAVVDGLKGFPEAINAAFPETVVQTCIVHLIRHSLEFVSWKDRKAVVPALRAIYRAQDAEAGMKALQAFEAGDWGRRYPAIALSWRRNWTQVVPFFAYPEGVRRIIYTTNAIEALNSKLRRAVRTRGHFPNDEAAMKLLYLVLIRFDGRVVFSGLPIVRFTNEERLEEIVAIHEANGCPVFNPHRYTLEEGGMKRTDAGQLAFKREADPKGLLNPGKMVAWENPDFDFSSGRAWLFSGLQRADAA